MERKGVPRKYLRLIDTKAPFTHALWSWIYLEFTWGELYMWTQMLGLFNPDFTLSVPLVLSPGEPHE